MYNYRYSAGVKGICMFTSNTKPELCTQQVARWNLMTTASHYHEIREGETCAIPYPFLLNQVETHITISVYIIISYMFSLWKMWEILTDNILVEIHPRWLLEGWHLTINILRDFPLNATNTLYVTHPSAELA